MSSPSGMKLVETGEGDLEGGKTITVDWDLQVGEAAGLAGVEAGVRLMSVVPCFQLMAK